MKKIESPEPKLRLAQIVDYDINTADCTVAFRHMFQEIKGLQAFVWLSYDQEIAVYEWWAEHGNGEPLVNQTFSTLRGFSLPEKLCFWKLEGETATEQRQRFIAEEHRLRGYGDVKHYKKGEEFTSQPGEEFTIQGWYAVDPQSLKVTRRLRRFVVKEIKEGESE